MYENNGYAHNMPKKFFQGLSKFFLEGEALPLLMGLVTRSLGMQKSLGRPRLDWYMGMYSERLLVRFLLDTLKFSVVDLDNSAWEFD